MSWRSDRKKWLNSQVPPEVPKKDIEAWLRKDPIWQLADEITFSDGTGSHFCTICIRGMSGVKGRWNGNVLNISTKSGKTVDGWLVRELVAAYKALQGSDDE